MIEILKKRRETTIIDKKKWGIFVVFFIGGLVLIMQHWVVGMYFDDFGNASLSYGYDSSKIAGTNYAISDLLDWSKFIYFNWGGRILYALMLIPLLKNGAHSFMMIQAIILLLIFVLMYKIIKRYCKFDEEPFVIIGLFALYGLLNGTIMSWGIYWASASVLYLWPILPFLICVYLYGTIEKFIGQGKKNQIWRLFLLGLFIPWVTLSQEQIGGAFLVWIVCRIGIRVILYGLKEQRKYVKSDCFVLVWSLISFMVFFLAPGNWRRMDSIEGFSELSIIEKIKQNIPTLLKVLNDRSLFAINVLLLVSGMLMIYMLRNKRKKSLIILFVAGVIPFSLSLLSMTAQILVGKSLVSVMFLGISFVVFLIDMFFLIILFSKQYLDSDFIALMVSAVASVACLLISPSINLRSCILYTFICMLLIGNVFYTCYRLNEKNSLKYCGMIFARFILIISVINLCMIYAGYRQNYEIEKENIKELQAYNGIDVKINLKKYPNDMYRAPMPYDEGYEYVDYWIREYFDISQAVVLNWAE